MTYEEKRDRNKHVEEIIDYLVEVGAKVPNLYEVSDEEFENLKQESDKYFIRNILERR